jgi:cell division protein FtsL
MSVESPRVPRLDETQPLHLPDARPERRHAADGPTNSTVRVNNAAVFAVVALAITTVGLLYLIQTTQVASLGYEISRLERERVAASLENQRLTYEVARYEALPEINRIAQERLGMQPLDDYVFLTVTLPPVDDLPLPSPEPAEVRSLPERIWDRLTGQATAANGGVGGLR